MVTAKRLFYCRLGFVLLCVLPTFAVGGWAILRSAAGAAKARKADVERELTSRLGLAVEIDRLRSFRSGGKQMAELRLLDPETRNLVATASQVEISPLVDGWRLTAAQLTVESDELPLLARMLEQRVLRVPIGALAEDRATRFVFMPGQVVFREAGHDQSLLPAKAEIELAAGWVKVAIAFSPAGAADRGEPIQLTVIRDRSTTPPQTRWQLQTRGTSLPCRLAVGLLPQLARLGVDCEFDGLIQLGDSQRGTRGHVSGVLHQVDLDSLVSEQFPHQLSGRAGVRIERALVERGKLLELHGAVQAQHGTISRSLIAAAAEHLRLTAPDAVSGGSGAVAYRRLELEFHLNEQALSLHGSADPVVDGAIIANAGGAILIAPPGHSVAATNLVRALLPGSELQVPAARQTSGLVNWLPVPEIVVPAAAGLTTHTPTRLAPAVEAAETAVRPPVLR